MRLFEILILLTPVLFFLWPIISRQKRPQWVALLPVVGLLFLFLHLVFERYRWQMIPVYGLTVVLLLYALWQWRKQHSGDHQPHARSRLAAVLLALVGLVIVGITAVLPIALPVPRLAQPDGP
jgi:hypothetical protein